MGTRKHAFYCSTLQYSCGIAGLTQPHEEQGYTVAASTTPLSWKVHMSWQCEFVFREVRPSNRQMLMRSTPAQLWPGRWAGLRHAFPLTFVAMCMLAIPVVAGALCAAPPETQIKKQRCT